MHQGRTGLSGLMALWFVGCGPTPADRAADARALPAALAAVAESPADAVSVCAELRTAPAQDACVLLGVERLARTDPDAAAAICGTRSGLAADECYFQVAERSSEPLRCEAAGRFAEDCRMHAWSARVQKLAPAGTSMADWGDRLGAEARAMGFAADDVRPWIAAARFVLGQQQPLDRAPCSAWPAPGADACRQAGLGLFHDRINHTRDFGAWDCTDPLPELLGVAAGDDELEAVFAARRGELCP